MGCTTLGVELSAGDAVTALGCADVDAFVESFGTGGVEGVNCKLKKMVGFIGSDATCNKIT